MTASTSLTKIALQARALGLLLCYVLYVLYGCITLSWIDLKEKSNLINFFLCTTYESFFCSLSLDDKEKQIHIRFLVANTGAGCIIGKGGSTITEFQSQSGSRIQVSRNHEYFPGTQERIILVSGTFDHVLKAMELILEKLINEVEESNDGEGRSSLRLIVPNGSCGGIIGRAGATIKTLIEESGAVIKISPQDHNVGLNDRLVTLTGSFEEQMRAIFLILSKLQEDTHYSYKLNSPFTYSGYSGFSGVPVGYVIPPVAHGNMNYRQNGHGGKNLNNKVVAPPVISRTPAGHHDGQSNLVTIGVADEHIGAIVGRGGRNIMEISQVSGARIKISDKGDFMSGTSDRKVTITGSSEAIHTAESMIMQKVSSNSERG